MIKHVGPIAVGLARIGSPIVLAWNAMGIAWFSDYYFSSPHRTWVIMLLGVLIGIAGLAAWPDRKLITARQRYEFLGCAMTVLFFALILGLRRVWTASGSEVGYPMSALDWLVLAAILVALTSRSIGSRS